MATKKVSEKYIMFSSLSFLSLGIIQTTLFIFHPADNPGEIKLSNHIAHVSMDLTYTNPVVGTYTQHAHLDTLAKQPQVFPILTYLH